MRLSAPQSIVNARVLLWVQASIWGLLTLPPSIAWGWYVADGRGVHHLREFILTGSLAAIFSAFAAGSALLAIKLVPGRTVVRRGALGLESFMTCFGLFIVSVADPSGGILADLFLLAGLVGAVLSLTAVVGLLLGPARRFARSAPVG